MRDVQGDGFVIAMHDSLAQEEAEKRWPYFAALIRWVTHR